MTGKKEIFTINFDQIPGQQKAKKQLGQIFANNRLAHAYLFTGAEGCGKLALATAFAAMILCERDSGQPCNQCKSCLLFKAGNQPNLHFIFPHPKSAKESEKQEVLQTIKSTPFELRLPWNKPQISIEAIRQLRRNLSLKTFDQQSRVIIIIDAHRMTQEATNAVLKILEEPPDRTHFLLLSSEKDSLLPTIISRCQLIALGLLSDEDVEQALRSLKPGERADVRLIARLAGGNLRRAFQLLEFGTSELKEIAVEILRSAFRRYYELAIYGNEIAGKFERIQLKEILESLIFWLRDAYLISNLAWDEAQTGLTNLDEREKLQKFSENFPDFQYNAAIKEVELSIRMLERYVQPAVILVILMRKLRKFAMKP